ncbi:MAG: B12-binding domain-containing radical SAM protein [Myxococcota bacterium]
MKVLFANPPWWAEKQPYRLGDGTVRELYRAGVRAGSRWPFTKVIQSSPDQFIHGDYCPYPFFMGYAASYAKKHTDAEIYFRDSIALKESDRKFVEYLHRLKPDFMVYESATPSWEHDLGFILKINQYFPTIKIILTGPITSMGKTLLEQHPIHACIRGEYEKGVVRVLNGESGFIDYDMLSKAEMNAAPFPWYDEQHAHRYWDGCPIGQKAPQAHVWSSRGCPYKCIFCVWPATMTGNDPDGKGRRTVRHYSPDYMEAFLTELIERYDYKCIYFDDDTFNLGNSHVVKMCEVMRKLNVPWSAMCRADTSKMESWQLMKDSGCFGVKLGFESGNQFVVDKIVNKHLDLDYGREVVNHLKSIGMTVHGTFTYGLPGETKGQMQDTHDFVRSLPFDSVQESGTAEIEGTPLSTLSKEGHLDAYSGANIDEGYDRHTDGARKMQDLAVQLRNS